ncbi:OmpA family protein [Parvibaculum sedimenti]|uniref:OmpA family protein n=1 Tax=Parvibaculum sedimenti TaxID=2608632 RepID=A0A6N6VMU2_9HYPH|nr:OmpA family protein [Parvibaculum sedimenti]KAB7742871.1 OmpA family protein [Parvibaculum sedimenti]
MRGGRAFLLIAAAASLLAACQTAARAPTPVPAPAPTYSMASADAAARRVQAMLKKGLKPIPASEVSAYMDSTEHDLISELSDHGFSITRVGNSIHLNMEGSAAFAPNSTVIAPKSAAALKRLAHIIKVHERILIDVTGHTDNEGKAEANRNLSEGRARSVAQFLIDQGADGKRFLLRGAGAREPIASNRTAKGRAQNRRVEIKLSPFTDAKGRGYKESFAP